MKILIAALIIIFLFFQFKLWIERDSVAHMIQINKEIVLQKNQNKKLIQRNQALMAEVHDLKNGNKAIEADARSELGMIKKGEKFYQIIK